MHKFRCLVSWQCHLYLLLISLTFEHFDTPPIHLPMTIRIIQPTVAEPDWVISQNGFKVEYNCLFGTCVKESLWSLHIINADLSTTIGYDHICDMCVCVSISGIWQYRKNSWHMIIIIIIIIIVIIIMIIIAIILITNIIIIIIIIIITTTILIIPIIFHGLLILFSPKSTSFSPDLAYQVREDKSVPLRFESYLSALMGFGHIFLATSIGCKSLAGKSTAGWNFPKLPKWNIYIYHIWVICCIYVYFLFERPFYNCFCTETDKPPLQFAFVN